MPLTKSQIVEAPEVPEEITYGQLDRAVRARLRTLSKDNAEDVGRHLIMAGNLVDLDPELAYRHAQVALQRGGRVDVVREAAALTAYATGRYAEALRELRTVRRLGGSIEHLPLMADCERGLGRPERALAIADEPDAKLLPHDSAVEMQIVIAGARLDMGDPEAALLVLTRLETKNEELQVRADEARVAVLRALGRDAEADELEASLPEEVEEEIEEDIVLYDTAELPEPEPEPSDEDEAMDEDEDVAYDDEDGLHEVDEDEDKA
ncbi:hypothetical protein SAMN05421637_2744 [Demequina mangrovi]|uniref:Tetratricopeptide repeat-containing protein n=1 Tax=Demequina mangrovi TaxID=1043493 RepID=A0A1H7B000_9MICO|nr:hypothetical protein SAMN05421637_2744 [Demequina mangrovi]